MKHRRHVLLWAIAALAAAASGTALAQQFPSKPIKIITAGSPGTSADTLSRFFAEQLTARLNVPVLVENRSGAGGLLAYQLLMKAPADGYTLLTSGAQLFLLPLSSEDTTKFDPVKDFVPVARVGRFPTAIVVSADSPYRTLASLLDAMKAKPNDVTYSSMGVGSGSHLCSALLAGVTKSSARHVPYRETGHVVTDVISKQITFSCQGSANIIPLVKSGRLRALAVTSTQRWESLPDVPTAAEAGVPGFEMAPGVEFIAPAGTPGPAIQVLSDALTQIAQTPRYKEFLTRNAILPEVVDANAMRAVVPKEVEYWRRANALARD
ncbi:tripartite tricarboxylate transporter substrate binding protein [Variovorax paradoxus]|nr:tripartite tricarboxylate transporter substrate binding protein [Variovorax paradoxus]